MQVVPPTTHAGFDASMLQEKYILASSPVEAQLLTQHLGVQAITPAQARVFRRAMLTKMLQ